MMGKGHSLSAAAGWVAGCAGLAYLDNAPSMRTTVIGALVSAGFGLVPDADHPGSTISRTLGPVTWCGAKIVAWSAARVRMSSCRHCARKGDAGGHRQFTHTAVFALSVGWLATLAAFQFNQWAGLAVVWLAVGLTARVAFSKKERGTLGAVGIASIVTACLWAATRHGYDWSWIGIPVAWGCLAHDLGDSLTRSAAPILWPLPIRGCTWRPVGLPRLLRFRTGSAVEKVVTATFALGLVAGSGYILAAG